MEKILAYSGLLNLYYVENDTSIYAEDYSRLKLLFQDVTILNDLVEYVYSHDILNVYPDVIMIDAQKWDSCMDILEEIRSINPKQIIIIIRTKYAKDQLLSLMTKKNILLSSQTSKT
ncbi:MAG: hypothetical protein Q9M39_01575 [Sulfurovum sp.]|nr:hypothetical protein [Sulfurovum sp.]